jgi:hypothetical protein
MLAQGKVSVRTVSEILATPARRPPLTPTRTCSSSSDAKIRGALYKLHNEQGQAPLIFAHQGAPKAPRC